MRAYHQSAVPVAWRKELRADSEAGMVVFGRDMVGILRLLVERPTQERKVGFESCILHSMMFSYLPSLGNWLKKHSVQMNAMSHEANYKRDEALIHRMTNQ